MNHHVLNSTDTEQSYMVVINGPQEWSEDFPVVNEFEDNISSLWKKNLRTGLGQPPLDGWQNLTREKVNVQEWMGALFIRCVRSRLEESVV